MFGIDLRQGPRWLAVGVLAAVLVVLVRLEADRVSDRGVHLKPLTVKDINAALDYSLNEVARTKRVPRLFIGSLEVDLGRIRDVNEKKRTFFRIMLPIIARENDRIRAARARILAAADDEEIADLFAAYKVEPGQREQLLRHVDVVPASLALAQAAVESGWGSSRFARHGNNFFGMRTYDDDAPGIAPKEADGFKVSAYPNIAGSVRAYMRNLNTHMAYAAFRRERVRHRHGDGRISGLALAGLLTSYSEIPETYGAHLRAVINKDRLQRFEGVRLQGALPSAGS